MAQRMDPALAAGVNRPFAGALVPRRFHRGEPQVLAVMIEVNRGLYMDEASGEAIAAFDSVARGVQDAVGCLVERVMPASVRPETAKPGA
jgi:N-formylglutamate amidohydrolase